MAKVPQILPITSIGKAIDEASELIDIERSGAITGLYCRWSQLNRAKAKYWRFGRVTALCGMSGSGKSSILNMLEDDFTNPLFNPSFLRHKNTLGVEEGEDKIVILAFKYEMSASDEILRNLSGKVKKSYSYLLSSEIDKSKSDMERRDVYNKVNDDEYTSYRTNLETLRTKPIVFIETAGNLDQLYNTCRAVQEQYKGRRMVVTIDHHLLSKKLSERDDLELSSRTAHTAIQLKKDFRANVIFLMQLNGEIEKPIRRDNPSLQYPVKTDIHCGNQVFWACDDVMIFHRPEVLHISKYGSKPFPLSTDKLIHCAYIKGRFGKTGNIFFEQEFDKGGMIQITPESKKWKQEFEGFSM